MKFGYIEQAWRPWPDWIEKVRDEVVRLWATEYKQKPQSMVTGIARGATDCGSGKCPLTHCALYQLTLIFAESRLAARQSGLALPWRREMRWSDSSATATSSWVNMLGPFDSGFAELQANCLTEGLWHIWALS